MYRTRTFSKAAAVSAVTGVVMTLIAVAAPPAVAQGVATVSATEYRHIDNGMTKGQVHHVVGGAPQSVQQSGKHVIETFRGWDHGSHALVRVTYKTTNGETLVTGTATKAEGGGGGGGGCGACGVGRSPRG
jgi:hypothetical protein